MTQWTVVFGICLLVAWRAVPAGETPEWGIEAGAGYRYDSNVNVARTDTATGEADSALLLNFGVEGSIPLGDRIRFGLGYDYSGTNYRVRSDFDLAVHHVQAKVRYQLPGFSSALSFDSFSAGLDGARFVDVRQVSPSLGRLLGERLYLRGSYARAKKSYTKLTERSAVNDALRADLYVLIDGMRQYLAFSYRMDGEDAAAERFDYDGGALQVRYGHGLRLGDRTVDLKMDVRLEHRDYAGVFDAIDAPRRDERLRAGLNAALPLNEHFSLEGEIEYRDNASNLRTADFAEAVYTVNVAVAF